MIELKSTEDLAKLSPDDPVFPIVEDLVKCLITDYIAEGYIRSNVSVIGSKFSVHSLARERPLTVPVPQDNNIRSSTYFAVQLLTQLIRVNTPAL